MNIATGSYIDAEYATQEILHVIVYSDTLVSKEEELVRLHARIQEIKAGWNEWSPDDPVKSLVKRGVDAARQELHVS